MKEKTVLIDANNLFFACYCADPTVNQDNMHIGGITASFKSLQKVCNEVKPHKIIFVWDGKGSSSSRKKLVESYKEGRTAPKPLNLNRYHQAETPEKEAENRRWQQARFIELLNYCPVIQICEAGVEADDVISHLVKNYKNDHIKIIMSNDKDYLQLVEENVLLYRFSSKRFFAKRDVVSEYGVLPSNMALIRAIEGDKSDNLPGVPLVGMKTVLKYFPQFGKQENILIDDFYNLLEDKLKEKKLAKTLQSMSQERALVEKNYSVMQLYSPMIDAKTALQVESIIDSKEYDFNVTNLNFQMMKDGLYYSEFMNLIDHFVKIQNFNKKK
jgi:5'-3' exonuclease